MQNTKSGPQVILEFFLRAFSATAGIYLLMALIWLMRAGTQGISNPLQSDDPYLIALFLSIWCLVPTIPASIVRFFKSPRAGLIVYWIMAITQVGLLYYVIFRLGQIPGNEVDSSPGPLLSWIALPLAGLYYPLFFYGKEFHISRKVMIVLGAGLALYGHS